MMALVIIGWLSVSIVLFIMMNVYNADEETLFIVHGYVGNLVNLSISFQYPVYYIFCKNFRIAFKGMLTIERAHALQFDKAKQRRSPVAFELE